MRLPAALRWLNRSRWAHLLAALLFAGILAAQYRQVIDGDKVFTDTATQQGYVYPWAAGGAPYPFAMQSDQADLSMPAMKVQQRAYQSGELPQVDLYSYGGGYPLFTDFSTSQAYPPRMVLVALFQPVDAHFLFTMLHLFGAGLFTYLLLRRYRCSWLAAVFGGTAWMLGGWNLTLMHLAPLVVISALFPAALWAIHRTVHSRTWESIVTCGVTLGALVVAGHVLFGVVAAAIVGLYGLAMVGRQLVDDHSIAGRERWRRVAVVPASGLVAVGVWSVILVPLAIASGDSARGSLTFSELTAGQLATWRTVGSVVWPFAAPLTLDEINGLSFVGFATVVLALFGIASRRRGTGLGRALVIGSIFGMVAGPGPWLLFHVVPLMDVFRPYSRLAFFLGFGVVLLGSVGMDCVADRMAGRPETRRPETRRREHLVLASTTAIVVVIMANAVQLARYGESNNPPLPPRVAASVFPDTPFTVALRGAVADSPDGWPGRAAVVSGIEMPGARFVPPILWAGSGAWVGVEVSSGYNSSMPTRSQRLLRVLAGEPIDTVLRRDATAAFVPELWWGTTHTALYARSGYDLVVTPPELNETSAWARSHLASGEWSTVYAGPDGNIYRIVGARPGAHGVARIATVGDDTAALTKFTDDRFDAANTVLLSPHDADRLGTGRATLPIAQVSDASRGPNGYRFTVESPDRTLVVVPVNWGAGWTATADGHELPLARGNYNQIVVEVPKGTTDVSLVYRSPGLTTGMVITCASLLVLLLVPSVRWALRRRSRSAGEDLEERPVLV